MNDTTAPFDPENFLDGSLPGSNSTKFLVVPQNTYPAFIADIKSKSGTVAKEGPNFGKPWTMLNIQWQIDDGGVTAASLNRPTASVFQTIMLDFDDEGGLAMGKGRNVPLGKLREAIGLNDGPVQFRAFLGRPGTIKVDHEIYQGEPQARVTSVAKR